MGSENLQATNLEPLVFLDIWDSILLVAEPLHRAVPAEPLHHQHRVPGQVPGQLHLQQTLRNFQKGHYLPTNEIMDPIPH